MDHDSAILSSSLVIVPPDSPKDHVHVSKFNRDKYFLARSRIAAYRKWIRDKKNISMLETMPSTIVRKVAIL